MSIKKKSKTKNFLEGLVGHPLSFSELIESVRLSEESSQVDFAKKLGISKSHLCDIEKGRKGVSVSRASEFAEKLGYSKEQFIRLALQDEINSAGLDMRVKLESA